MSSNPFHNLDSEDNQRPHAPPSEVEKNVTGSIRTLKHIGETIDLFLGKMMKTLVKMIGADADDINKNEATFRADADDTPLGNAKSDTDTD